MREAWRKVRGEVMNDQGRIPPAVEGAEWLLDHWHIIVLLVYALGLIAAVIVEFWL